MNFEIIPTSYFEKFFKALAKRHRSLKNGIIEFIASIQENPFQGDELSPGIRKICMAMYSYWIYTTRPTFQQSIYPLSKLF